ncbi:NO-inducible flavohemoprotein [Shimazuella kribbensis]|uniref:NO-inducible flavohemoprotein n=1 Tax=Shimazuella kribbensis TaxID=139808 RepID=UPI000416CCDB|nr:NO-inducible flavohemoprotein [Shimazuella kribbensis]
MLDKKTIKVIQSTVPVLEQYGEQITSRFYELLFHDHPELYHIFNIVHQHKKEQQRALANAVYQAAAHIDQLPSLLPALQRVFQKHRSLGVKAEHYPVVGKYLLIAIKDVLGDLASDEIMKAWEDAYGVLASIFISQEENLYQQAQTQNGGWEGWREFVIKRKVPESKVVTSFYLYPTDGNSLASFKPGQYISLKVPIEELNVEQIRQYSLSDAPREDYYRISVKREDAHGTYPAGYVSSYLHHQMQEGDKVMISAPAGDFYLNKSKDTPVVFISGGVGFTPLMSMLNTLIEENTKRSITTIHATMNSEYHAMREYVQKLTKNYPHVTSYTCYEKPTKADLEQRNFDKEGFLDLPWLSQILSKQEAEIYFCGPIPFMRSIKQILKEMGIKQENIHYEFFGPASQLDTVSNKTSEKQPS